MALPIADAGQPCDAACSGPDRRGFLFGAGAMIVALPTELFGRPVQAEVAKGPRKIVGKLADALAGQRIVFRYPVDDARCDMVLLKLDQPAAGGVGPEKNIVAFNVVCPHLGYRIEPAGFHAAPGIAGPCRAHLTTFDLTRHGMVVSGHSTAALPQALLEVEGADLVAVGLQGLLYGHFANPKA